MQVLIIDDSPELLDSYREVLTSYGYDPIAVESADKAIQMICKGLRPDLVIVDNQMPRFNGVWFSKVFKFFKDIQNIPVILCSASNREIKSDADLFLRKPFNIEDLIEIIEKTRVGEQEVDAA